MPKFEFVTQVAEEWHSDLIHKTPRVVSKKVRKTKRQLPSGLDQDHFRWLCRYLARWHRRHAGKCDVMSGWSSDDDDNEESDSDVDEDKLKVLEQGEIRGEDESETDCNESVSKGLYLYLCSSQLNGHSTPV